MQIRVRQIENRGYCWIRQEGDTGAKLGKRVFGWREWPVHRKITGQKYGSQEILGGWWSWSRVKAENLVS